MNNNILLLIAIIFFRCVVQHLYLPWITQLIWCMESITIIYMCINLKVACSL